MPIHCRTPRSAVRRAAEAFAQRAARAVVRSLAYAGEAAVREMRSYTGRTYTDRTGNLRSSTGYVLVRDGKVVSASAFERAGRGSEGEHGGKTGEAFARSLAEQYAKGYALIIVAGMNYASYVQDKGLYVCSRK